MKRPISVGLIASIVLTYAAGCKTADSPKPESRAVPPPQRFLVFGTAECPNSQARVKLPDTVQGELGPLAAALIAVVVPILVEKGIELAGSALTKASGKDETTKMLSGSTSIPSVYQFTDNLSRVANPAFGCIVVARGTPVAPARDAEWWKRAGLGEDPPLYLESQVEYSEDYAAFRLVPVHFQYREPLLGGKGKPRDLEFRFQFAVPGETAFGSASILLSDITPGSTMDQTALRIFATPWMPLRPLAEAEQSRFADLEDLAKLEALTNKQLSRLKTLRERLRDHAPTNIAVTVTETRDYGKLLAAAGELLTANKKELAAAISPELIPADRQKTRRDAAAAEIGGFKELAAALAAVEAKEVELTALNAADPVDARAVRKAEVELVQLKYDANLKALAAEMPPFYEIPKPKP